MIRLNNNYNKSNLILKRYNHIKFEIKAVLLIILLIIIIKFLFFDEKNYFNTRKIKPIYQKKLDFDVNFDYIHYQQDLITQKMIKESGWLMTLDVAFLINGLIRKYKPQNCLEIGVAKGGSSILILNAIKDLPNSRLISIDLYTDFFNNQIGYLAKTKFPELTNKWNLFTGNMPHKILVKLNIKFDFLFLDSAHVRPGEFFNLIEALPFLNENAIIVLHDTMWHLKLAKKMNKNLFNTKVKATNIYLFSSLVGKKILVQKDSFNFANVGVVCLKEKQEKYYLNYFLLLLNIWQYMPLNNQLKELRNFIIKYYKSELFVKIFDISVHHNQIFFKNNNESGYKNFK